MSFTMPEPKDSVPAITDDECLSLRNNTGIDPSEEIDNCQAIARQILPLLKQELDMIATGNKPIFANEDSKCKEGDPNPTIASILSRLYRVIQAISCNLCSYDPNLIARLKSGTATQVLWGQGLNNLPVWKTPDTVPTKDSANLATSGSVYDAINIAKLGTFHLWENNSKFTFFANTIAELNKQTGAVNNDTALVLNATTGGKNQVYTRKNNSWVAGKVLGAPEDFATIHIVKGDWTDKELYFFFNPDTSTASWNVLDANLDTIKTTVEKLTVMVNNAVTSADETEFLITTRPTLAEANAVIVTPGKKTIVLITDGV